MGSLTSNRKAAAVPKPSITTDVHEPLDVHGDFLAEITFDPTLLVDHLTDRTDLFLVQVLHTDFGRDARLLQDDLGAGMTDPVDMGESDIDAFLTRQIDACNSCHGLLLLSLSLLVLGIDANDAYDPVSTYDFALRAYALD
jgi:hypothetical protein